ncbi:hypothetical protein QL093DRAFT_2108136 [Fusarium oxysporum]|nr:hypothetical protein QL093DRAFT_2108136 [Fusarium oxysporum]
MDDLAKQIGAGLAMLQERKGDPLAPVPKVIMELTEELNDHPRTMHVVGYLPNLVAQIDANIVSSQHTKLEMSFADPLPFRQRDRCASPGNLPNALPDRKPPNHPVPSEACPTSATHGTSASPSPTAPCQLTTSYREKTLSAWQRKLVGIPERRRSQSSCTIDGDYQTEVIVDITSGKQVKVVKESLACVDPSDIMVSRDKLRREEAPGPRLSTVAQPRNAEAVDAEEVVPSDRHGEHLNGFIGDFTYAAQPGDDPHDLGHAHYFDPERAPYDAGRLAKTVTGGGGNFY